MDKDLIFIHKYLRKHWDLPFDKIQGYKILNDIISVFGISEEKSKNIIKEWFCDYEIDEDWYKPILKLSVTRELIEDLRSFHGFDVIQSIEEALINELRGELNHIPDNNDISFIMDSWTRIY